ncbi:Syntaxin-6 [Coemansia sp. RSA 989]|nr:t-SNARE [Coemansia mojavensis]KAJ1741844.1 Syntaxin-6 [Coemansia sp. RSA 1086]KAJ1750961.1 Syntaxin-6 [Coemansia sp. RSA 1821]KAJ1864302.1 Syntaxin-6 [Coemansia sp. RSA 989]KAJ1871929.1 Syntaxin-6 [Coemansia sp. RSA 990]KAJ2630795.1 Syntaxin-6 [Coemansia sp. RSA 1290]KAJ2647673.1 Syntaxin-6 [Coemansia sp. RSA 1250]KAJ2674727.1 Syntaxin-6 [Coemansia sp. RSA 1085]
MTDPFLVVQEDVVSAFEQAKTLFASWKGLHRKKRSPQEENEFQFVTDELYSTLKSIDNDLEDLQETVDIARSAPAEYGLSPAQISERHNFIAGKKRAIEDMRNFLNQPSNPQQQSADTSIRHHHTDGRGSHRPHNVEFEGHQQQHQVMIQQQDEQFDAMLDTVRNLHGIASTMNTELDDQAILLDEVGSIVDRTQAKLSSARKKVDKFLRDNNSRSICIVLSLFAAILVLLLLIIFT